jgi:hypothetical protein
MELSSYIREKTQAWLSAKPGIRSYQMLADRSKLGYSTVRRLTTAEEPTPYSLQALLQLASVILTPEETREVVKKHFPDSLHILQRPFTFATEANLDPIINKESMLAVALACPDDGIEFEKLVEVLGSRWSDTVNALLESEILRYSEGRIKLSSDYVFDPDPKRNQNWIRQIVALYDYHRTNEKGNFTAFRIHGFNDDGIDRIQRMLQKMERELEEITGDAALRGPISLGVLGMSVLMTPRDMLEQKSKAEVRLENLARLYKKGFITEEEFGERKKAILDEI